MGTLLRIAPAMGNVNSDFACGGATAAKGKSMYTKCICFGCGLSDYMCAPALAGDIRCCCFEANVKVDPSQCHTTQDLCAARAGCKTGPFIGDVTNPLVDRHELVVF